MASWMENSSTLMSVCMYAKYAQTDGQSEDITSVHAASETDAKISVFQSQSVNEAWIFSLQWAVF